MPGDNARPALTKERALEGASLCLKSVRRLLRSSKALREVEPMHALALYSLAIEEYGKELWLQELATSIREGAKVPSPEGLFTDHHEKLRRGFETLSPECK